MPSKFSQSILPILSTLYLDHGQTVDRLALYPDALASFATDLNSRAGLHMSPQQALEALFYFRKRGLLPRLLRARTS